MSRAAGAGLRILRAVGPPVVVLLAVELALRLFLAAPSGYFHFLVPASGRGLHPPDRTQRIDWGPIPFVERSNRLGLRITSPQGLAPGGKGRIAALGDSITDGFFVDDEATWPFVLQTLLDEAVGPGWQVLNAAHGGASIPKELAILREIVLPLEPDVVLLTFVTNDVYELRERKHASPKWHGLVRYEDLGPHERAGFWLATHSALAESLLRLFWENVIRARRVPDEAEGDERYRIAGGGDFTGNTARFWELYGKTQGALLVPVFTRETRRAVDEYLELLNEFASECTSAGATPVLVYFPAYPQVYAQETSLLIRDVLREAAKQSDTPFLDLTPDFRREGRERVLHLAPVDYHLNPDGNELIARSVFAFLRERSLVE